MRIFKSLILFLLIITIFTSSSYNFVSRNVDKTINVITDIYSKVESYALSKSNVTEITYEIYNVTDPQFDSSYKCLNSKQKELYKLLFSISQKMPNGFIKLHKKYDDINKDVAIAYNALLYDRTEIFWMPYTYILSDYRFDNKVYTAIAFNYEGKNGSTNYNIPLSKRESMQKKFDEVVDKIVLNSKKFKSEYEIEKFFNDYICENTEYVTEGELLSTAYGALVYGQAHCEGYSRAFKHLCNKVEIECDLVCGESFNEGHMWNMVNIDGKHSFVDVTWNDRSDYKTYLYFNITGKQVSFDHKLSPLFKNLSDEEIMVGSYNFVDNEATYTGNSYYVKSNFTIPLAYEGKIAPKIKEQFEKGNTYTELLFTSKKALSEFKNNELGFIKKIQSGLKNIIIDSYLFERDVLVLFYKKA